jgi:hypothetical protein
VILSETSLYDVPLMPTVGYTSETFAFEAVESADPDKLLVIYALYDFDRSGRDAANSLREKIERFAKARGVGVIFYQLGISEDDILGWDEETGTATVWLNGINETRELPTRPPKRKSKADQRWPHPYCIELDAIEPDDLRAMVRKTIEEHLPPDQFNILKIAEASERDLIQSLVEAMRP